MSLIYGYSKPKTSANALCSAINTYDALQLAYKKLAITCSENGNAAAKAAAEAMKKANSASYRARKADEAAITGNKHITNIQGRQKYKILKDSDDSDISNIQDVYTSLRPCSVSVNLMGKNSKTNKPNKPVKLKVIIQYIELSGGVSEIEHNGPFGK